MHRKLEVVNFGVLSTCTSNAKIEVVIVDEIDIDRIRAFLDHARQYWQHSTVKFGKKERQFP